MSTEKHRDQLSTRKIIKKVGNREYLCEDGTLWFGGHMINKDGTRSWHWIQYPDILTGDVRRQVSDEFLDAPED